MQKICQYCFTTYRVKQCLAETSKFCSRACHDRGKTYKNAPVQIKMAAIKLRTEGRLSVGDIARKLEISYGRAARYVKPFPLSVVEKAAIRQRKLVVYHHKRWPRTNAALLKRLGITSCEHPYCTWSVTLEVHHIDGNRKNNDRKNIKILCPNHHSITPNYRNKKRKDV